MITWQSTTYMAVDWALGDLMLCSRATWHYWTFVLSSNITVASLLCKADERGYRDGAWDALRSMAATLDNIDNLHQ